MNIKSIECVTYKQCFSCKVCALSCPKQAISMKENLEGFFYPVINQNCVNCGICLNVCQIFQPSKKIVYNQHSFVAYLKDKEKLFESSSGGLFAGLAECVINNGGVVFGASYDDNLFVSQIYVDNLFELKRLKGSKYVESDVKNSFAEAKEFLITGREVLYSGTPCQIAGLRKYLGREYTNLLTVDLICHGVPSQKLFQKYLMWRGEQFNSKITYCGFRDKDCGGYSCNGKIKTKTKTKTVWSKFDPYYASFIRCETYKESCYSCPYASLNRPADITIGDFTEMKIIDPSFDLTKGLSLCIINTEHGEKAFNLVKNMFYIRNVEFSDYINIKSNLSSPSTRPVKRNSIYNEINTLSNKMYFSRFKEASPLFFIYYYFRLGISKILPPFIKIWLKKVYKK